MAKVVPTICKHCKKVPPSFDETQPQKPTHTAICETCAWSIAQGEIDVSSHTEKEQLHAEQRGLCALCKHPMFWHEVSVDHIRPRSRGGCNCWDNKQLTHKKCNNKKGNKWNPMEGCPRPHKLCPRSKNRKARNGKIKVRLDPEAGWWFVE